MFAGTSYGFRSKKFDNEQQLEDYVTAKDYDTSAMPGVCAGIVVSGTMGNYWVKLRYDDNDYEDVSNPKQIPSTRNEILSDAIQVPDKTSFDKYHSSGFTYLQYLITKIVLKNYDSTATLRIGVTPMKTAKYVKNKFLPNSGQFLVIVLLLCYIATVFRIVSMIVQDKEQKTREGMKMMGLKDSAYWISFCVYYLIVLAVIAVLLTLILRGLLFAYSSIVLVFVFFLVYGISVLSFCVFIASLFHKSRIASVTAIIVYFSSYVIYVMINSQNVEYATKTLASLIPMLAGGLGMLSMTKYETGNIGVNFSNATQMAYNYRFSTAMLMMAADAVIYMLLGLYLDNVLPSPDGVRKHPLFFLTREFWSSGPAANDSEAEENLQESKKEDDEALLYPDEHFDKVGDELRAQEQRNECLKVRHLNKTFGFKQAVQNFSVNMYKGQIFALLGPNGAGKTTTISMLTGLLPPTSGSAYFADLAIFSQMARLREMLGVCPQHDVLFESLTPREHLEIFAAFKGRADTERIKLDVEEILQDIDLKGAEDTLICNLSGGQQRKLSIGIAFIGKSDMIFLDEPTSGIDLSARKKVWTMLKKYKAGKVIILTTHYMEEAEELGDRIGIMANGTMKCVGDPLFLKSVYGVGYNLVVVKKEDDPKIVEDITAFLKNRIPGIRKRREAGKELTYFMPKEHAEGFKEFFLELDSHLEQLKIQSYGMTTNTLEEIFLKVVSGTAEEGHKLGAKMESLQGPDSNIVLPTSSLDTYSIANEVAPSFFYSFAQHFAAIMVRRYYMSIRSYMAFLCEILAPLLVVLLGLIATKSHFYFDGGVRWFTGNAYADSQNVLVGFSNDAMSAGLVGTYLGSFESGVYSTQYTIPSATLLSGDLPALQDMDSTLFATRDREPKRYGSVYVKSLSTASHLYEYVSFVNISSQDSAGAFSDYFGETLLRTASGNTGLRLVFANAPLPLTYKTRNMEASRNGDIISETTTAAFAFIPASIISFIAREVEDSLKHQQVVSGMLLSSYWAANLAFDMLRTYTQAGITIGLIAAFGNDLPNAWWFILSYAISILPFTYVTSFLFKKENVAQVFTLLLHFLVGVVVSPMMNTLRAIDSTREVGKELPWAFRFIPSFSMAHGLNSIGYKNYFAALENTAVPDDLDTNCGGADLWFLLAGAGFFFLLLWIIESTSCTFCGCCEPKVSACAEHGVKRDDLVLQDAKRCDMMDTVNDPPAILARHIRKLYPISSSKTTTAVDDVSFSVRKGECFALLGASGAGKTTTFKMITRDVTPTQGDILVYGMELGSNFSQIRRLIGYAPQYESSYMSLTVRENLEFYGKIKGIPTEKREALVRKMITDMDIDKYENVEAGQLSGGNKRKLTVAIALLGNPSVVLLDEPSTGVDPQARRFMWHVIQKISTKSRNTAVVITTHLMEEAEYLCTKMGMMVGGNFSCVGTPQELKALYGKGYEVEVNIPLPKPREDAEFVERVLTLPENATLSREQVLGAFARVERSDLAAQLTKDGHAAHIQAELEAGRPVRASAVANFVLIEQRGRSFALELAKEFGGVGVAEHIGNFFKFRVNKTQSKHTIGFLFGLVQDLVRRYSITQYSASQTSLGQIFDTFAKKQDYGLKANQEEVVRWGDEEKSQEVAINMPAEVVPKNTSDELIREGEDAHGKKVPSKRIHVGPMKKL